MIKGNKEKAIKVAIYCRVSTDEQANNSTIENQVRNSKDFLKNNNSYEVYDYYKDDGVSGSIPFSERPAGKRLIEDAREGKFSHVIVNSTDRLGRSLKQMIETIEMLSSIGISFRSISEPYDTETPEGMMMFNNFGNYAEFELNIIRRRFNYGKQRAIEQGKWPGGLPPYGRIVNEDTKLLQLYEDKVLLGKYSEVDVIRKFYSLCVTLRISCHKIAERLNQEGIPPYTPEKNKGSRQKKAKYWTGERVRNMIKDPINKGLLIIGKRSNGTIKRCEIRIDPIVSEEVWDESQRVLKDNIIQATRNTKYNYLLTGKLVCSECNRHFTGHNDHGIFYYSCNNNRFKNNKNPYKCHNRPIRADVLEEEVWGDINSIIKNPDLIRSFLEKRLQTLGSINTTEAIENAQKELRNIERQKQNLVNRMKYDNGYLGDIIVKDIENLKIQEESQLQIIANYQDIDKRMEKEECEISRIEGSIIQMVDKIENPEFEVKKGIANILLDKVIVNPYTGNKGKRNVEIYYKFKENPSSTDISTWIG